MTWTPSCMNPGDYYEPRELLELKKKLVHCSCNCDSCIRHLASKNQLRQLLKNKEIQSEDTLDLERILYEPRSPANNARSIQTPTEVYPSITHFETKETVTDLDLLRGLCLNPLHSASNIQSNTQSSQTRSPPEETSTQTTELEVTKSLSQKYAFPWDFVSALNIFKDKIANRIVQIRDAGIETQPDNFGLDKSTERSISYSEKATSPTRKPVLKHTDHYFGVSDFSENYHKCKTPCRDVTFSFKNDYYKYDDDISTRASDEVYLEASQNSQNSIVTADSTTTDKVTVKDKITIDDHNVENTDVEKDPRKFDKSIPKLFANCEYVDDFIDFIRPPFDEEDDFF